MTTYPSTDVRVPSHRTSVKTFRVIVSALVGVIIVGAWITSMDASAGTHDQALATVSGDFGRDAWTLVLGSALLLLGLALPKPGRTPEPAEPIAPAG